MFRTFAAWIVSPVLALSGRRFDKSWRHGDTRFREFVYRFVVSTVCANYLADTLASFGLGRKVSE